MIRNEKVKRIHDTDAVKPSRSERNLVDVEPFQRKIVDTAIGTFIVDESDKDELERKLRAKLVKLAGTNEPPGITATLRALVTTATPHRIEDEWKVSVSVAGMRKRIFYFSRTYTADEAARKGVDIMLDELDRAKNLLLDRRIVLDKVIQRQQELKERSKSQ